MRNTIFFSQNCVDAIMHTCGNSKVLSMSTLGLVLNLMVLMFLKTIFAVDGLVVIPSFASKEDFLLPDISFSLITLSLRYPLVSHVVTLTSSFFD